ncbi:hypothetical protein EHI8A_191610 [Entamoeba histolytica HM-1:IMSS-B]|uniref:Uncharacterized protein n=6 Tax=Entamoeba TaxID=5758 RepID=C4LZI7_ENTH1|nr:hypothetical protein EHI_124510 [Entamoeba histolytica HM-1:IMSS]EAL49456.2 hypothetical protein EHI_124510 [Entamoeba histolytica HM-1:IMSS]EMH73017.1 hypothetical protein EHI8A_191610 [Entamoeba histolytica HM-1:IMSS-B]ENY63001.1 hypothetical protein EHI7A_166000 [Entamoeba histolytica HM-1:IMSS-A]|eukprot:XP_654842.2 hypothetical protein EHI_124510 [Entamoeba histolytica HM-1:IMSS]
MSEIVLKQCVRHCLNYPANNCYGYICNGEKVIAVSHAPCLPPLNSIIYDEIAEIGIEAMYVSSTTSTVPHPYLEFAKQKSIPIIYLISLYNPSKRIQKFKFNSNNKWEPTTIECELKGVIVMSVPSLTTPKVQIYINTTGVEFVNGEEQLEKGDSTYVQKQSPCIIDYSKLLSQLEEIKKQTDQMLKDKQNLCKELGIDFTI